MKCVPFSFFLFFNYCLVTFVYKTNNNFCRYSVKVLDDHLVSLQMMTSKPDVYIKLQILDHEEEIISAVGKGHVVLPAFVFQKDNAALSEEENKRSSSRQCKLFN